jgi:hypothetical protein
LVEVFPLIVGCVGESAAYELRSWSEVYSKIPDVEDIFEGKICGVPLRPEILFALSSYIVNYAHTHKSYDELKNAVSYAAQLPLEFRNRIFNDLLHLKGVHKSLSRIAVYDDWFLRSGRDWEDYGVL